jgi:dUTP pyrophosphatase
MLVQFKHLTDTSITPTKAHKDDACFDLYANHKAVINQFETIGTGISIRVPTDYVGLICSRSGMASRGLFVVNAPGIIDAGYTGEIKVVLGNLGGMRVINQGDRIAQFMILPLVDTALIRSDDTPWYGARGDNGFGSSGN